MFKKLTFLALTSIFVFFFYQVNFLGEKIKKLNNKLDNIIIEEAKENKFIQDYFDYVNSFVKDHITTYRILKQVNYVSKIYKIDPVLVLSIIEKESNFDSSAISNKGAIGLMQILPETGEMIANMLNKFGYNLFNIEDNIELGVCFLAILLKYNSHEDALKKYYAGKYYESDCAKKYAFDVNNRLIKLKNLVFKE